jgi:hypothetical protein
MEDTRMALSEDDHLIPVLLDRVAAPPLPTNGLFADVGSLTHQPVRRGQGKGHQDEEDMDRRRSLSLLGRMPQRPLGLTRLEPAVLDEAAVVVIEGLRQLRHRLVGQEHRLASWAVVPVVPLAHHPGIDWH